MISILIDGEALELQNFQITFNLKSPIFNTIGSFSYPFSIPNTIRNRKILKFRHRIESSNDKYEQFRCLVIYKSNIIVDGLLNVKVGGKNSFEGSIYTDSGDFYYWMKDKILQQYQLGDMVFDTDNDAIDYFNSCVGKHYPEVSFSFPEIFNDLFTEPPQTETDLLSYNYYYNVDELSYQLKLIANTGRTYLVPFLFVKGVLKKLFERFGYQLTDELFSHPDFNKLVFYNSVSANYAVPNYHYDIKHIFYNLHLPFMMVRDFIKAIEGNWNAKFFTNMANKNVRLCSIDSIIKSKEYIDFSKKTQDVSITTDDKTFGYKISMTVDPDDDYAKAIAESEDTFEMTIKEPVEKFIELPSSPVDNVYDLRYARDRDLFFYITPPPGYAWTSYGSSSKILKTRCFIREMKAAFSHNFSTLSSHTPFHIEEYCKCGNKFLNYKNVTPRAFFVTEWTDNIGTRTYGQSKTDNFSLFFDGATGLFEMYWKAYLDWKRTTFAVTIQKQMDFIELKELDFSRKYMINGVVYLLSEVQVTLTNAGLKPAKIKAYVCP